MTFFRLDRFKFRWPTASLGTWLVAVLLLATLPIAGLMAWQLAKTARTAQERVHDELKLAVRSVADAVERELAASVDALESLGHSEALQRGDVAQFQRTVATHPHQRPGWISIYLIDRGGALLFDTREPALCPDERQIDPLGLERMLQAREAQISNVVTGRFPGVNATAIEVPVLVNGAPRYVLGAWIDAAVWQQLIETGSGTVGSFTDLFDRNNRLIARTLSPSTSVGQPLPAGTVATMRGKLSGVKRVDMLGGGEAYAAWHQVQLARWGVSVAVRAEPLDRAHREALHTAIATALVCLVLGIGLALLLARRMTRPLHRLASHGAATPFEPIAVREIAQLRDSLLFANAQDALARDRLRSKADEFETLFESSPIGLAFAQDPQCRVVLHNAAMSRLFGDSTAPQAAGVQVLRQGRLLGHAEQPLQVAAAEGSTISDCELEIRIEGAEPRFVIAHALPLLNAQGRPRGAIGAVVDITERTLAEARLMEADRRLRESQRLVDLAQEAGHVGFFHYEFERDALAWTPGQAMLFGLDKTPPFESSLGEWVQRIDAQDRGPVQDALRAMLAAKQENETVEFRVALPAGHTRWLSSRLLMSYDGQGRPVQMVGVSVDMTDQKEAERERALLIESERAARLQAEQASRAKDEFLAMLGHELRNPMSAIGSAVELLNRVDAGSEVGVSARHIIERQTRHLARLLDDLLDVGRVISGKILLSKHAMDLCTLVQRQVATLQMSGVFEQHDLQLDLQEAWTLADATRIEQVISNLITNAAKYTPAGGRIEVGVRAEGDVALLEVRDTGVGIPAELLPRIFDLFVQGERSLDRRAGGLGVGLTLVRRLVELHEGRIEAESSSAGSVFRVRLPGIAAPVRAAPSAALPPSRRRRIVVVEDNEDALEALRGLLELDGHTVSSARDGEQGLAVVLEDRPDVAIVDIGLPRLTGFEVALRSRRGGYAGQMIAVSGYGQGSDVEQALKAGFDAHLVKPVDAEALRRLLVQG
ncbi:ATP-binding protein [Methylibium sp.]|uniref:ATP-binding protein n=1 Tax=Methylibium sp. TaxID=2067992 RepID=UPI0017E555AD|nr:ATP-binding protein [Methylibium sp.]MBA3589654.1 response regulator [Methylibium sp.]